MLTKILGKNPTRKNREWKPCSNCWICERWAEVKFEYFPDEEGPPEPPIYLHLECDHYNAFPMETEDEGKSYFVWRMIPPRPIKYFYSNIETSFIDEEKD